MKDELLANLFEGDRQGSLLCRLEVGPKEIVAIECRPAEGDEPYRLTFPLLAERISFAGDENTQILVESSDGARLYAERSSFQPVLEKCTSPRIRERLAKETRRAQGEGRRTWTALALVAVGLTCFVGIVIHAINLGVDRMVDKIPVSWETSLGQAVIGSFGGEEVIDPEVVGPVTAVLDRVLEGAKPVPYRFHLRVVRQNEMNAFAAPGGEIVVYTGLLQRSQTPDQLAGVLAHEVQHVLGRHGLKAMAHTLKWKLALSILTGDVPRAQSMILTNVSRFANLSYGRALEAQADLDGCRVLVKAHVDPKGFEEFFELLKQHQEDRRLAPEVLEDHPDTGRRIEAIKELSSSLGAQRFLPIDVNWVKMKRALAALEEPTSKAQHERK